MTYGIGAGLLLNILFWTAAVLVVVGLASLAVIEYFPGREQQAGKAGRDAQGDAPADDDRAANDETGKKYRKAS